jgi:sulfatase maturation enzyme AslB (radical SAM superfamily)
MSSIFCPMIHGGLNVNLKTNDSNLGYNQCCLSTSPLTFARSNLVNWQAPLLEKYRETNNNNIWLNGCWQCENLEKVGVKSFRKSMIEKFGNGKNLTGPKRIDLLFDRSCNLACRTCGPQSSTFWTKHLKDNNLPVLDLQNTDNIDKIKNILKNLNLENVGMIQFCGGETLMGNTYWQTAELLAELIPDAKNNLELGFQTNGTQPIDPKWFDLIEKFKLVKLMISIDGVGDRFEYLRWPANWNQTVDNIMNLRETLPSNVMFFVQECTSCLNMNYFNEVGDWVEKNFATNREGDRVDHSTQLASHPYLNVRNITQEYMDSLSGTPVIYAVGSNWEENPDSIKLFITETEKFDQIRGQDWKKTFPKVAEFYRRYL